MESATRWCELLKLWIVGFGTYRLRHGDSMVLTEADNELLELNRRAIRGAIVCDIVGVQ